MQQQTKRKEKKNDLLLHHFSATLAFSLAVFPREAIYWGAQVKWVFTAAPWDLHQQTQFSLSAAWLVRKEGKCWVVIRIVNNEFNEASITLKSEVKTFYKNDHFALADHHILPPDATIWLFSRTHAAPHNINNVLK